jgi:hypothetical protein
MAHVSRSTGSAARRRQAFGTFGRCLRTNEQEARCALGGDRPRLAKSASKEAAHAGPAPTDGAAEPVARPSTPADAFGDGRGFRNPDGCRRKKGEWRRKRGLH